MARIAANQQGRELTLLLAVGLPFIFLGAGSLAFLDPDEGMYGAIAREMAEGGDWITPHFNGIRYLEKPPLQFWLSALTMAVFGPSEWAVRVWSGLPALGTVLLVWRMGNSLYRAPAGLLSGIILATSIGVFRYVRVAATDFLLVFSMTLVIYGFMESFLAEDRAEVYQPSSGFSPSSSLLFYIGLALAVLSKGLIGLVLPLLVVGFFLWFSGSSVVPRMNWKIGLLVFFSLILPWHLLVAWRNPGFFEFYIVDNQFLRFLSSRAFIEDDIPVTTVAFIGLTFVWFFPWSLFLSGTLRQGFPNPRLTSAPEERLRLLVGLWGLAVLVFFSLSSSKLEHYALPALPPLSLMVGALWSEAFRTPQPLPSLKWPLVASAIGCSLVGVALILLSQRLTSEAVFAWLAEMNVYYRILKEQGASFPYASVAPFVPLVKGVGITLVIGLPLSLLLFCLGSPRTSFIVVTGVATVIAVLVFKLLLVIEPHHSAKSVALVLKSQARPGEPIVHEGSLEYSGSLPFYTGRQVYVLNGRRGDLEFGSRYPEGQGLFLDDEGFARRWKSDARVFLITRLQEGNSILKRLPAEKAFFLGRYGSRSLYSNHGP